MGKNVTFLLALLLTASCLIVVKPASSDSTPPLAMRITDFDVKHPDCLVWNFVSWTFDITVENLGIENVEGATLMVQMFDNGTELLKQQLYFANESITQFGVNAGEKREITGHLFSGMPEYFACMKGTLTYCIALIVGEEVLDEYVPGYGSLAKVGGFARK